MSKERNTSRASGIHVGSASIVMVFAVLALTVFAVLTLVTADNEYKLSEKTAEAVRQYYAADCEAARTANEYIRSGALPDGQDIYTYTVPIGDDDRQQIRVTLESTSDGIRVLEWCAASAAEWSPDDSLDVFIIEDDMPVGVVLPD